MFLVQERLLKQRRIHALFHQLPPIHDVALAIRRLAGLGLLLLTLALLASVPLELATGRLKLVAIWIVWGFYFLLNVLMWRRSLSPRTVAWLASVGFLVPLISLWLVTTK